LQTFGVRGVQAVAKLSASGWTTGAHLGARPGSIKGSAADSLGKGMAWRTAVCGLAPQVAGPRD
jgi:hypothetical protein